MRIAILGPFTAQLLTKQFDFPADARMPVGYPGAPLLTVLARALVERGHEVATITTDYIAPSGQNAPFQHFRSIDGRLDAYFCPQRARSFRPQASQPGRALDFFAHERECLVAALKDYAPDIAHAHWTYEFVWAALDSGYPTLATAHDSPAKVLRFMPNLYRAFRYAMARRVIPRCEHLTAVSPDLVADLSKFTRTPIQLLANPIDDEVMRSPGSTPQSFESNTLMMVLNGWNRLKNGATALRAFHKARIADPRLKLMCFGASWQAEGPAHQWARRNGVAGGVQFRGPTPHDTILAHMQYCAALLHPSRWEACCMAIAESMSLGLPVIAGRHTDGVPWQLDEGRAGMLVDVTDVDDMARGIAAVTGDAPLWRQLRERARERARAMFSIDHVVDSYLAMYRQAMAAHSPEAATA